jgi:hypothetical protein
MREGAPSLRPGLSGREQVVVGTHELISRYEAP